MATKLLFRKENGRINEVGYCRENPKEVLSLIYTSHDVYQYKDIIFPTECNNDSKYSGLILKNTIAPRGTEIVASVNDYGLGFALKPFIFDNPNGISHPAFEDDEEIYFDALRNALHNYLGRYSARMNGSFTDYFGLREFKEIPIYEKLLDQLQEIAEVTLKLRNPTPKDLEFIAND